MVAALTRVLMPDAIPSVFEGVEEFISVIGPIRENSYTGCSPQFLLGLVEEGMNLWSSCMASSVISRSSAWLVSHQS